MSSNKLPKVYLARHGETEWTLSGQHTGRTDIPLTANGERNARQLGERLKAHPFAAVFTSPLSRAKRTCQLAGFADPTVEPDLMEWDYGKYEGVKTVDIRKDDPNWFLFRDGTPGGESPAQIGARADRVIAKVRAVGGDAIVFAHGHMLRVFAARWLGLPPGDARFFLCGPGSLGALGYEHNSTDEPTIYFWNDESHLKA